MFRKLIKNKKAQNTAEYAILISLVVAGIIAMQTYAQRALQAKVRDTAQYYHDQRAGLAVTDSQEQYEPYYLETDYEVTRNESDTQAIFSQGGQSFVTQDTNSVRRRAIGGSQVSNYDDTLTGVQGGV